MLECPDWASPGPPQKVKVHGLALPYNHKIILIARLALTLREGSKKSPEKPWSLTKPGGGGFSEGTSKTKPQV